MIEWTVNSTKQRLIALLETDNLTIKIFSYLCLFATVSFLLTNYLTDGSSIRSYFVQDFKDSFMDYFNMLHCARQNDPYFANSNYPAICFVILKILLQLVPNGAVAPQEGSVCLRACMPAMLSYMLLVMLCLLIVCFCIRQMLSNHSERCKNLVIAAFLFSGPVLFMIERGNLVMIALAATMLFFAFYDSQKSWQRYVAAIALAFAASIKIYPIVFILLFFQKRRLKEGFLTVSALLVLFFIPFFFFNGFDSMRSMLDGMFILSDRLGRIGFGLNYSFRNLANIAVSFFTKELVDTHVSMFIPAICGVLLYIVACQTWEKVFALALLCVWVPAFSYTYSLVLFIPFVITFLNATDQKRSDKGYQIAVSVLTGMVFALWALPRVMFGSFGATTTPYNLYWGCLIGNAAIAVLFVLIFVHSLIARLQKRSQLAHA